MIALRFENFGSIPEVLKTTTIESPKPRHGEVLVRVVAAALNPSDAKNVLGQMHGTSLPRTPGRDFAGDVVEAPDAELPVGAEVWGSGGVLGFERDAAHAEFIVVPSDGVAPKPASLTMTEAAAVGTAFITAYLGLVKVADVRDGDWVVVTGANGAVGSAVLQLAPWKRARTIRAPETIQNIALLQLADVRCQLLRLGRRGKCGDAFDCRTRLPLLA
jgi:NADPH2:quinone reductase